MIKKTIHIGLALLILLSSSGLIINKHFCQNELVDTAFYSQAASCHESIVVCKAVCDSQNSDELIHAQDCCKDVSSLLKVKTEQKIEIVSIQLTKSQLNIDLRPISWISLAFFDTNHNPWDKYSPPLLVSDLLVDLQTFLC